MASSESISVMLSAETKLTFATEMDEKLRLVS